jgi:hypothetical protein
MNFWLADARPALLRVLERVDLLVVNDEERGSSPESTTSSRRPTPS